MKIIIFVLVSLFCNTAFSQSETLVVGTWEGKSDCQIKNSPCHNETVVYHITPTDTLNKFHVQMMKITEGKEEDMGSMLFTFDPRQNTISCINNNNNSRWRFKLSGSAMYGTLYYKSRLYRIIQVKKRQ